MHDRIKELLQRYNLEVHFLPIKSKGYIITTPHSLPNMLVINEKLSDAESEKVILHEIGHAKKDDELTHNYKTNYRTRICSECKANAFMIHEQVKEYVLQGNDASSANWLDLARSIGTDNYLQVREELRKYCVE